MTTLLRALLLCIFLATRNVLCETYVYSTTGLVSTPYSLCGGYDINGDNKADVIVGAPSQEKVFIFFAFNSDSVQPNITLVAPASSPSQFGSAIAVGDCNADGYLDIFIGAPGNKTVFGYYGNSSGISTTPNIKISPGGLNSNFGTSIAMGKVNSDIYDDLLIGDANLSVPLAGAGAAYLYLGTSTGLSSSYAWLQRPALVTVAAHFGASVALADVTGDGLSDAIIGSPYFDNILANDGSAFLYVANSAGLPNNPTLVLNGTQLNGLFGNMIVNIGDINADGFVDVGVIASGESNNAGNLYVYQGQSSGLNPVPAYFEGGGQWGAIWSVAPLGDMDQDGYDDIMLSGNGSLAIARGGASGIINGVAYDHTTSYAGIGSASSYAGDIDQDTYLDLLLGDSSSSTVVLEATSGNPFLTLVSPVPSSAPSPTSSNVPSAIPSASSNPSPSSSSSVPSESPSTMPPVSSASSSPESAGGSKKKSNNNTGAIVGGIVGGVAALGCGIILAGFLVKRKKKNTRQPDEPNPENNIRLDPLYANAPKKNESHYETNVLTDSTTEDDTQKSWKKGSHISSVNSEDEKNSQGLTAKAEELLAKHWEIEYSDIKLGSEIGKGGFGVVYKARWMGCDCVVKQLNISQTDKKAVDDFLKEANTVRYLRNHQNICSIFGVCTNPQFPICIVMEYVSGGNLQNLIFDKRLQLDVPTILKIARDVTGGMSYLHKVNVLHCDLACRNLLVSSDASGICVKITDFGLSHISHSDVYDASKKSVFPIRWSAPEVLTQLKLSRASDVWSFGVVMYEVLEAKVPYYALDNPGVVDYVCEKKKVLPKPTAVSYPPVIYDIMLRCWNFDPALRPSFDVLCDLFSEMEESTDGSQIQPSQNSNSDDVYGARSHSHYAESKK